MSDFNAFMRLTKADDAQRLVWGILCAEVPDHSNEILDYETAVPAFKAWSEKVSKASDGKSLGNVRAQHGNVVAGVLKELTFDDATKSIMGCAHILDDNEWNKVKGGAYTGFSIGGKYTKRWQDPANAALKRYTPEMIEVSIVDLPCNPVAQFEYIKQFEYINADGTQEMRKFKVAQEAEEIGVAIKQVWQARDATTFDKKADAVSHNVDQEVAAALAPVKKALQEADEALKAKEPVVETEAAVAEPVVKAADAPPVNDAVAKDADDSAAKAAEDAKKAALAECIKYASDNLNKGLYDIAAVVDVVIALSWLQDDITWNALFNNTETTLPSDLKAIMASLCDFLNKVVADATAAITADKAAGLSQVQVDALRKFSGNPDALKDYVPPKPPEDLTKLQASHAETVEQLEIAKAEKDALVKSMAGVTDTITAMQKRIEHLEAQPLPAKGLVATVVKRHEGPESGSEQLLVEADLIARKYAHYPPELGRAAALKEIENLRAK